MVLNENANGRAVSLVAGETFEVVLGEIRTAGYGWRLEHAGEPVLTVLGENFYSPVRQVPAPGSHSFRFRAERDGQVRLRIVYGRSADVRETLSIFEVEVTVHAAEHATA